MTNEEAIKFLSQIMDALLASNSWLPSTDNPIKESFGMAINALKAQEQLSNNSPELDKENGELISRQAAIDAILAVTGNSSVRELYEHVQEHGLSEMWSGGVNAAIDIIIAVPSAQPEKRTENTRKTHSVCLDTISRNAAIEVLGVFTQTDVLGHTPKQIVEALPSAQPETHEKRTETHSCGCISRKAAIDALEKVAELYPWRVPGDRDSYSQYNEAWNDALNRADSEIEALPSVQPEIIRCHQCGFWDRDTLQHNFNDFRDWNEAECLVLAERDGYHEINRYTEADDFCSRAERRTDGD